MEIKFGTGGFRGVIGDDFTKETVRTIAQAISNIIINENKTKEIVVGYDHRFLSNETGVWMSEVFAGNGIKTKLLNSASPSPTVMYLVREYGYDFGVMITASHNPYLFNGVKVFEKGGYDADVSFTNQIEKEMKLVTKINSLDIKLALEEHKVEMIDGVSPYVDYVLTFLNENIDTNLKLAFDNLHGVGAIAVLKALDKLGFKNITTFNKDRDALFGNKMPNPIESNLTDLKEYVVSNHLDFGFSMDSDADRLGIIDEKGNYVSSNEILGALYYYLIKYRGEKGDIVKNCATSNLIDKIANNLGYKCKEVDVGFKNITHTMSEIDALIGGESSGGLTVRGYIHGKDSTFAIMMFLNMVSEMKKPVSEIVNELHNFADFHHYVLESFISYKKEHEKEIIEFLNNNRPEFTLPLKDYQTFGRNYKFIFEDDQWILIRLSGTEPVFRIFSEMKDKKMAENDINRLNDFVRKVEDDIQRRNR